MAYTVENFKTAKALREAFKSGKTIRVFQPGPFGPAIENGLVFLEGPHYPAPHSWYASGIVENGILIKLNK